MKKGKQCDVNMIVQASTDFDHGRKGNSTTMDRRNQTKPTKGEIYLLKDIGNVHGDKASGHKHPATMAEDPMAEELRQMSREGNSNDESFTGPSRRWLTTDRSRVVGVDRTWDGLAYVGVRHCTELERHKQRPSQSRNKKSSSLDVERGSHV